MEVLKSNFHELLPTLKEAIRGADFIALDTELTGLSERIERIKSFDDPQSRYTKVRAAATKFLIVQFGICTFTYSKDENTFVTRPFNFYIFPANAEKKDQNDICFMCSGSSLHFLMNCGFDFNKLISQGIPFINYTDEEKLTQRKIDLALRQTAYQDNPLDEDTKTFVEKVMTTIEAWLNGSDKKLTVETPTVRQKRLIFQEFRARYKGILSAESRPKSILFEKLTDAQKEKISKDEAAEVLAASMNFRTVIGLLVESKKPLVGHNCFLDMCQLVQQFWTELPEKLKEWKKLVRGLFDLIIDTKHLTAAHPKLRLLIPKNSVQDILQVVQTEPFEKFAPKIEIDPKFTRYTLNDESRNHEAGYDAYITGYNFIRLTTFMFYEKEENFDLYDDAFRDYSTEEGVKGETTAPDEFVYPCPPDEDDMALVQNMFTSEKLTRFYNKLHLLRSDFKFISLDGEDGYPPTKPNGFLLSNIPASCNHTNLYAIFGAFGNIFFQWIDDTHCWLTVKDDKKVSKVPRGVLGQTKLFSQFSEEGDNYGLALEKGITKEMGEICIQSWSDWVKPLLYVESEDEEGADEKRNSDAASMDDVKVENGLDNNQVEIESEVRDSLPVPHDESSSWEYPREDNWANQNINSEWLKAENSTYSLTKVDTWTNCEESDDVKGTKNKHDGWGVPPSETLNTSIKRTLSTPQPPVEEEGSDTEMNGAFKKTRIG